MIFKTKSSKKPVTYFGESITGRRPNNEDFILCEQVSENGYLFIVADGMGGSEHGEVASKLAANTFLSAIRESFQKPPFGKQLKSVLEDGFHSAQIAVREKTETDTDHSGMGTTLVVLLIHNGLYVWGNIGDSRLYRIDSEGITQITRDHTYIEEVLKKIKGKAINEDHLNQYSHIITRSLSGGNDKPDIFPEGEDYHSLRSPTAFLLCSDGLISKKSNKKDELEFLEICQSNPEPESFARKLVSNAFEKGSEDNISAVCVSFGQISFKTQNRRRKEIFDPLQVVEWFNKNVTKKPKADKNLS